MTDSTDTPPTVLVVDDERDVADLYTVWLADDYDVLTAYGGQEALDQYNPAVDMVLLDRRMPDLTGDDVLAEIRDRGDDCQVIMVTAVEADFDILEMGFDAYLTKPVGKEELQRVITRMLSRRQYDEQLQTYQRLVAKRAALEAEKSASELAKNDEFTALKQRLAELEAEIDETLNEFDETDFEAAFRDLDS